MSTFSSLIRESSAAQKSPSMNSKALCEEPFPAEGLLFRARVRSDLVVVSSERFPVFEFGLVLFLAQVVPAHPQERHLVDGPVTATRPILRIVVAR